MTVLGRAETVSAAVGTALFAAGHVWATVQRGYEAVGGEMLLLGLPVLVWMVRAMIESERGGR